MSDKKHLWEVKHPYYCNEGQYFATGGYQTIFNFETFKDFLDEWGNADLDYNMLFRWDWEEGKARETNEDDEDEEARVKPFKGDIHERNGQLQLFIMHQRKGYHSCCIIRVCRADEPAVIDYLQPRMQHLLSLWAPLAPATSA